MCDVAAPCLARALARAAQTLGPGAQLDALWPCAAFFAAAGTVALWRGLADSALEALGKDPQLPALWCASRGEWLPCCEVVVVPPPRDGSAGCALRDTAVESCAPRDASEALAVGRVLAALGDPVVCCESSASLRVVLSSSQHFRYGKGCASRCASPCVALQTLSHRDSSPTMMTAAAVSRKDALATLRYAARWCRSVEKCDFAQLDTVPLVPLSSGAFGRFHRAPDAASDARESLAAMGFGELARRAALAAHAGDLDAAVASLLDGRSDGDTVRVPFYLVCDEAELELFANPRKASECRTVRHSELEADSPELAQLAQDVAQHLNLVPMRPALAPEVYTPPSSSPLERQRLFSDIYKSRK